MSDNIRFDYIIIGAGTAGCLLANRLSADASKRVLLIEAGRRDDYHWIHIPVGYLYCIGNPRTDWLYQTEPDAGLNGRALRYPRGKTLGGCSSINGMIYMRGQARDYDQWAQLTGDASWSWDSVLPAFKRHEDHWRLDTPEGVNENFKRLHGNRSTGSTGEWRIEKQRLRWDVLDAFAQAAQQAGIPATEDFNTGNNEGVGYFEVNQRRSDSPGTWRTFTSSRSASGRLVGRRTVGSSPTSPRNFVGERNGRGLRMIALFSRRLSWKWNWVQPSKPCCTDSNNPRIFSRSSNISSVITVGSASKTSLVF